MRASLACAVGLLGLADCKVRPPPPRHDGPVLSFWSLPPDAPPPRPPIPPGAAALALGGLPPEELPHLRESLNAFNDAAVRRAAPALFDIAGLQADDEDRPHRGGVPDMPALTAATNLLGAPWRAPGIEVDLGPTCASGATRCEPLFATPADDPLVRRGRALAWALSNAAILRVPAAGRRALVDGLRTAGTVALVLEAPGGDLDPDQLDLLRAQAQRALDHLPPNGPERIWLESLVAAQAHWAVPLPLGPDEILVIPRLSAMARLPRFDADLTAAGSFDWVVRPGA